MNTSLESRRDARRGGALLAVCIMTMSLAGVALALLAVTDSAHKEQRSAREEMRAQFVCEAGLNAAFLDLTLGGTGNLGGAGAPVAYGGADYWVEATPGPGAQIVLTATGDQNLARCRIEMVVDTDSDPLFAWAAFGDVGLTLDSNAMVDSYNSTLGSYASQALNGSGSSKHADDEGTIGSNADIVLKANSKVYGDSVAGPADSTSVVGNAQLSGATTPADELVEMPVIVVPSLPSSGPYSVASKATNVLPSGLYHFTSFQENTGSTLKVVGPATIVCDSFNLSTQAKFLVDATNGPVQLFVIGDFVVDSNTEMRSLAYAPKDLQIQLESNNVVDPDVEIDLDLDSVLFNSNAKIYGTMYAPNAAITIASNFELFGALIAQSVNLASNCKVHFDESLLTNGPMSQPEYKRVSWRVLQ